MTEDQIERSKLIEALFPGDQVMAVRAMMQQGILPAPGTYDDNAAEAMDDQWTMAGHPIDSAQWDHEWPDLPGQSVDSDLEFIHALAAFKESGKHRP